MRSITSRTLELPLLPLHFLPWHCYHSFSLWRTFEKRPVHKSDNAIISPGFKLQVCKNDQT